MSNDHTTPAPLPADDDAPVKMPTIAAMVTMAAETVRSLTAQRTELRKSRDNIGKQIMVLNEDIRQAHRVATALTPRQSKPKAEPVASSMKRVK